MSTKRVTTQARCHICGKRPADPGYSAPKAPRCGPCVEAWIDAEEEKVEKQYEKPTLKTGETPW